MALGLPHDLGRVLRAGADLQVGIELIPCALPAGDNIYRGPDSVRGLEAIPSSPACAGRARTCWSGQTRGKIASQQIENVDITIGAPAPQPGKNEIVVQDVGTHDVKRVATDDPVGDELGLRWRSRARSQVSNYKALYPGITERKEAAEISRYCRKILGIDHLSAIPCKKIDGLRRYAIIEMRIGKSIPDRPSY